MGFPSALRMAAALLTSVVISHGSVPSQLDMRLMKQVTPLSSENQAISPFLVTNALSQVWLGAGGSTKSELGSKIGVTSRHQLSAAYPPVNRALSAPSSLVTTAIFNRVYIKHQFSVKRTFISYLSSIFGISVKKFKTAKAAVHEINTDVARVTRNRIKNLVNERVMKGAQLVLVCALYFKGSWQEHFQPAGHQRFLTAAGEKRVQMMDLTRRLEYARLSNFDVVALPYEHPDYSMLIFRPLSRSQSNVRSLHGSLHSIDVASVYRSLRGKFRNVIMTMPRFKIEASYKLSKKLKALGIRKIFSEREADFSGISGPDEPVVVSEVIHKVFMEVSKNGTEAAGAVATVFFGITSVVVPPQEFRFTVDRPFLAVLYHNKQHVNLFSAWVADP